MDQGYGIYEGVGGVPYSAGMAPLQAAPAAQQGYSGGGMGGSAQGIAPSNYGAAGYAAMMPQWMQDYFDAYGTGMGADSLNLQRNLGTEGLDYLKNLYGEKNALNPYFTTIGGMPKGFDPFSNQVIENVSSSGRFEEHNPWFTYDKNVRNVKNPFSGATLDSSTSYNQTYGNSAQGGGGGYGMQDARRDALTGGLYSMHKQGIPAAVNVGKKLW